MEYNPRYPQPFSFSQAIALDPAVAWDEIARLKNSLLHLRRSQNELQEYLQGLASESEELDPEANLAMKENEITIASQDERVFMLKLALTHHGYSGPVKQPTSEPLVSSPRNTIASNSNGLGDSFPVERTSVVNEGTPEAEEQENGVYL